MTRLNCKSALAGLFLLCAAGLPACQSAPKASDSDAKAPQAADLRGAPEGDSGLVRAGKIAATVPENLVWVPWKLVGGALRGASDGVQAGYDRDRQPLLGTIFIPVNLVTGFLTGFVEGAAASPLLMGPDDNFGRVMGSATSRQTSVWWYP